MSQQELSALLYAYALGALDKEDYIRLLDYLESNGEYPWQELGEFQNLASLLPSFLVLQEPHPSVKDKVARKLYRLKEFRRTSPGSPAAPSKPETRKETAPAEKLKSAPQAPRHESFLKTIERRTIERAPEHNFPSTPDFPPLPKFPDEPEFSPVQEVPAALDFSQNNNYFRDDEFNQFSKGEEPQQVFGTSEFDDSRFNVTEETPGMFKETMESETDKPVYSPPPFVDVPPFHTNADESSDDEIPHYSGFAMPDDSENAQDSDANPFGRPDPETARPRQNTQIRGRNQNPAQPRNAGERGDDNMRQPRAPQNPPQAPRQQEEEIFEVQSPPEENEQFIFDHTDVNAFNPDFQETPAKDKNPFSFSIDPGRPNADLFQTAETLPADQHNLSFEDIRRKVVEDVKKEEVVTAEPRVTVVKEKSSPVMTILTILLLVIGCAGVYFLLDMKYKKEVAALNGKIQTTANEIKDTENKLSKEGGVEREILNLLSDKAVRLAAMNSVQKNSDAYGKIIYSLDQKKGYLQLVNFIQPPKGKQYHLWMNIDGKTTHLVAITDANIGYRWVKLENLPEFETAKDNTILITEEAVNAELKSPASTRLLTGKF